METKIKKDRYYFSHDANAGRDEKTVALRMKHGWEGYGLFWALIERLRESTNYTSVCDFNLIAYDLRTDAAKIKSIILDFGLFSFTENRECFYSESLNERMALKESKSDKARESARKRWDGQVDDANAMRTHNERNANAMQVKESKVKKSKIDKAFVPPSLDEFKAYCKDNGFTSISERAFNHYNIAGWKDSHGKPVKNWKQKVQTNWFREDNRDKSSAPQLKKMVL